MELLKSGTEVVVAVKYYNKMHAIEEMEKDGILEGAMFDEERKLIHIKGFVTKDDPIKGFSVVALENPEVCLICDDPTQFPLLDMDKEREAIRSGVHELYTYDDEGNGTATCQFK